MVRHSILLVMFIISTTAWAHDVKIGGIYCNITIPKAKMAEVTGAGHEAVYGCNGLTSVNIGNSVTSIGNSAFYGCEELLDITTDALNGLIKDSCTLYVPKGSILAYARATGWKDFVNIVEVDNDIPQDVNNDGIVDSQDVLEIYNYMQNQ